MKKFIDLTGASGIHALCLCQFFLRCIPDIFHRFKFTQKGFPPGITDPRDIIQDRMDLFPAPMGTMVFNGIPMGFILDPGNQAEAFAACVNGDLHIVEIQASRPMMIVLDHTADRYAYPKLIQHLQSDIYLPSSTIHQDQIRKPCKAVKFSETLMSEPTGQNLFHAGIIDASL